MSGAWPFVQASERCGRFDFCGWLSCIQRTARLPAWAGLVLAWEITSVRVQIMSSPITEAVQTGGSIELQTNLPASETEATANETTPAPTGATEGGKGGEVAAPPAPGTPPSPPLPARIDNDMPGPDIFTPAPARNPLIAALAEMGLYGRALGDGRHSLTCPWAHEHPAGADAQAIYSEPSHRYPVGNFSCPHDHASARFIDDLLAHCSVEASAARCKAIIRTVAGESHRLTEAVEYALAQQGDLYAMGTQIVAIRRDRREGDCTIEPLSEPALLNAMARAADYEKWIVAAKAYVREDAPPKYAQALLRGYNFRYLRDLKGIAHQPYFDLTTGTLIDVPGYNADTGIFGDFDPARFTLLTPERNEAEAALEELRFLIREFRFESDGDESAALSAMFSATVRPILPQAPAFNINATTSGSGKSLLADTVCSFGGQGLVLRVSYPTTGDEATKAMLTHLVRAPHTILFDDMQTNWLPHGVINRALTSETISDRILGSNRVATARTNVFMIGTGNNVGPTRDMCRRVITIRLNPRTASPGLIRYEGRPVEEVRARREHYVGCVLTIIRAWRQAGCPRPDLPVVPTYGEHWADYCRYPLIWLGLPDPAASLFTQMDHDPDREMLANLLVEWFAEFGDRPVTLRKVIARAANNPEGSLAETLEDLPASERGAINPSKLGWYLKRNAGRIVKGLELQKAECGERNAWRVVPVQDTALPALPPLTA